MPNLRAAARWASVKPTEREKIKKVDANNRTNPDQRRPADAPSGKGKNNASPEKNKVFFSLRRAGAKPPAAVCVRPSSAPKPAQAQTPPAARDNDSAHAIAGCIGGTSGGHWGRVGREADTARGVCRYARLWLSVRFGAMVRKARRAPPPSGKAAPRAGLTWGDFFWSNALRQIARPLCPSRRRCFCAVVVSRAILRRRAVGRTMGARLVADAHSGNTAQRWRGAGKGLALFLPLPLGASAPHPHPHRPQRRTKRKDEQRAARLLTRRVLMAKEHAHDNELRGVWTASRLNQPTAHRLRL